MKLETFPFTRYGTVAAEVTWVSADAVVQGSSGGEGQQVQVAAFPARVRLDREAIDVDGKRIKLGPGMNLTAEIKTGKRMLIDYLLSPVQKGIDESLTER